MKITFVLTHIPNPRMYKRIEALRDLGEVTVVCIRRLNQDVYTLLEMEGVEYKIEELEVPPFAQTWKRLKAIKKFRRFISCSLNEIKPDIIYTSGLDALQIVDAYSKKNSVKVIYEVADLRESYIKNMEKSIPRRIVDRFVCVLERKCFSCVNLLVITSQEFYNLHYYEFVEKDKVFEFPNVPDLSAFHGFVRKREGIFTVGFIGALRYLPQMKLLIDATQDIGMRVFFAGGGNKENETWLANYSRDKQWVELLGKYDYSKDIKKLYERADVIYSVYDADNANVRIALPNKLYESVYCGIPIIVAKNTYLAQVVEEGGVGVAVSHTSVDELRNVLLNLQKDKLLMKKYEMNCLAHRDKMDVSLYAKTLKNKVLQICGF